MNFPFSQKDIELKFVYETLTFFKTYINTNKINRGFDVAKMQTSWSKENDVDDYVKDKLKNLGLLKGTDFSEKDASAYLKEALRGYSKTDKKAAWAFPILCLKNTPLQIITNLIPALFL